MGNNKNILDKKLHFTGERLTTMLNTSIMLEHLHRYAIAMNYIEGKVVLDVASGEGYGTHQLAKKAKKVYGVDISHEAIEFSKQKYTEDNISFIEASATDIPLDNNSVDVIISFETIEHHDKHDEMLIEFKRILKSDGILIISSPDKLYYSDVPKYNNPFHVKELYEKEFAELINRFFPEVQFLYQKNINASFITPLEISKEILGFSGNYENVVNNEQGAFVYNIAIASEKKLETVKSSFFEADKSYAEKSQKEIADIFINSATWKIGRIVGAPFFMARRVLNKLIRS